MRPSDVPVQVGDPSKAERALGWKAEIPLERTLADLLQYWRDAVRRV
jgi:GDP-4-dehydro-6-deoxy-D-mannose reductase